MTIEKALGAMSKVHISSSQDPRAFPTYSIPEAAIFVNVKPGTLRNWLEGKERYGRKLESFAPLILAADPERSLLSFFNLVEAHILRITRKEFKVPMLQVRRALDTTQKSAFSPHPLLTNDFRTDGRHLFVKQLENYVNASTGGKQVSMGAVLDLYLDRIWTDIQHQPFRLFPVTGTLEKTTPSPVMVDPNLSSGRLVIAGTGIMASVAWSRHKGGESFEKLARDYRITPDQVRRAVEHLEAAA